MKPLAEELATVAKDLGLTLAGFSDDQFNRIPFEGSWTAGQVAEHILKSVRAMPVLLMRNVMVPARDPETHVKPLRDLFLDYEKKFISAKAILPLEAHHDSQQLNNTILPVLHRLSNIADTEDLTMLCADFEFPGIGPLTRSEMLNFTSAHIQRHIYQMKNIREAL